MRSDFYSLPWAAQEAIRSGESAESMASAARRSIPGLRRRVKELEAALADCEKRLALRDGAP